MTRWQDTDHKKRLKRRGFPIHGYVGPNGHGKSWAMVYDTLPSLDYGRRVLSTVRIVDYDRPRPCDDDSCTYAGHPDHLAAHPLYTPFTDYQQLLEAENCDVLMDEVTGVASSREYGSMPVQVANFLVQLRRRNVALRWTAPNWNRADKIIREVTQAVTSCRGSMSVRRPTPEGEAPRLWLDRRLFTLTTFDPIVFEDFMTGRLREAPYEVRQMCWRPGGVAERGYDTLDPVTTLGWANDAGLCMTCGGKRNHPKCSCQTTIGRGHSPADSRSAKRERTVLSLPDPLTAPIGDLPAEPVEALLVGAPNAHLTEGSLTSS